MVPASPGINGDKPCKAIFSSLHIHARGFTNDPVSGAEIQALFSYQTIGELGGCGEPAHGPSQHGFRIEHSSLTINRSSMVIPDALRKALQTGLTASVPTAIEFVNGAACIAAAAWTKAPVMDAAIP
jgi:hypothetical protein